MRVSNNSNYTHNEMQERHPEMVSNFEFEFNSY